MIVVQSYNRAKLSKRDFDAVITIEDPAAKRRLRFHSSPHPDHLILRFEDLDDQNPNFATAERVHVSAAIDFARGFETGRVLVHCYRGICRSTAVGLALMADRSGAGSEEEDVRTFAAAYPGARPNLRVLELADACLARRGRLFDAWMRHEDAAPDVFVESRKAKSELLAEHPEFFSLRPSSGAFLPMRVPPTTLSGRFVSG